MCSIIVSHLIDIILVCEENWLYGDIVLPLLNIWWGVMRLGKWYANLSKLAFNHIFLRLKSNNKPYPLKDHWDSSEH